MYDNVDMGNGIDGIIVVYGNVVGRLFDDSAVCVCIVQCVIWVLLSAWLVSWYVWVCDGCIRCIVVVSTGIVGGCIGFVCMEYDMMYDSGIDVYDTSDFR